MPTSEPGADASGNALGLIAHARYACRHSGVCCSSDWEIPVEDALHARLVPAIGTGEDSIPAKVCAYQAIVPKTVDWRRYEVKPVWETPGPVLEPSYDV